MRTTVRTRVMRWQDGSEPAEFADEVAAEEPLEIRIGGRAVSVTMRTPGDDVELAAGFLLTEGVIDSPPVLRHEHPNVVNAAVSKVIERGLAGLERRSFMASSCGLCGKTSIEAVHQHFPPVESDVRVSRNLLPAMLESLQVAQPAFARTGGVHAAGVFDGSGHMLVAREDIGRHNAVDKVIGYGLLRRLLPWSNHVLLVSGRASFEILQKALAARIPVIAAVSAPSSLAVTFAEESGQTLVGFVRSGRLNVYTHFDRITN